MLLTVAHVQSLQSCLVLCNCLAVACQASLSMKFSRQESWSKLPYPSPEYILNPRSKPVSLTSPVLVGGFFTTSATNCSIQSLSCVLLFVTQGLQHARPPCPSTTPGVYSNSCPLSRWCHPTISSSVIPFSSCLQSFPSSGSFQMSQFFAAGGQSIEVSASGSVLSMNIQDWFPLEWTGLISLQSKGLSRVFSNTTVQKHQFFGTQLSLLSNSHIHTWLLEKPWLWLDGPLLTK